MNIVLTGSLGHISKPLAQELLQKGHSVTIISSKAEKQKEIEAIGAYAAIGTIEDIHFLTATFSGADIVYGMEPPIDFFDPDLDLKTYYTHLTRGYAEAIQQSRVKRVVWLSSIGAKDEHGSGMLVYHYYVEQILRQLANDIAIKFIRPVGFYYNLFAFIPSIKNTGAIITNYGGDEKELWVSPLDIASVIAEEMETSFEGRQVRYVASDNVSTNEAVTLLGEAIGKPDLKWIVVPDEQQLTTLLKRGMNPAIAKGFVEMNAARQSGQLYEDYYVNEPILGKVKLKDFAKDFAAVYHHSITKTH